MRTFANRLVAMLTALTSITSFAHASTLVQEGELAHAGQLLAKSMHASFERKLSDGMPTPLAHAVMRSQFKTAADRAYIASVVKTATTDGQTLTKFRSHTVDRDVYTITTSTGRAFTLSAGRTPRSVIINGLPTSFTDGSAEHFVTQVEKALHRSYVACGGWLDILLPRADALAPVFFVYSLAALAVFYAWDAYNSPNYAGSPSTMGTERLARMASLCEAENEGDVASFDKSETFASLNDLLKEKAVDITRVATRAECESQAREILAKPKELLVQRPSETELRTNCETASRLATCVIQFKKRSVDQPAHAPYQGTSSLTGR